MRREFINQSKEMFEIVCKLIMFRINSQNPQEFVLTDR